MTTLTVHPTSATGAEAESLSKTIIAGANRTATITTASGRTYTLRRPDLLASVRLIEMIGAEAAQNAVLMGIFTMALHVIAIDAEKVEPPHTRRQLDALIQRIDEDYAEVVEAARALSPVRTDAELKAAVGNS